MKTILVIYGGQSVEHDISVITALQAMKNVKGYDILPLYIKTDGVIVTADNLTDGRIYLNYKKLVKNERQVFFSPGRNEIFLLKKNKIKGFVKPYCALLCNHGHGGEDGCLQGMLEMCNIPYSSSQVLSSAITMDKVLTKLVLEKKHILTPAYVHFNKYEFVHSKEEVLSKINDKLGFPCIVKPANGGSSVGISICEDENMLEQAILEALEFDDKILVEKFVENAKEFSCAVIKSGSKLFASRIWQVKKSKFFTFEEKYLRESEKLHDEIPKKIEKKIKDLSKDCYDALECGGVVRVDFLYEEETKKMYVGEINSIPGSLAFNLFPYPFSDLIVCLVEEGVVKSREKRGIKYAFSSSAIKKYLEFGEARNKK